MIRRVIARAYSNIALVKYWGKRETAGNIPATPSISLALNKLTTETAITRTEESCDRFILNDVETSGDVNYRLVRYLDLWRERGLVTGSYLVESKNGFPTASGLASSASGFAALAKALSGFSERKLSNRELSRLARQGSGSAARSITGGLSAFPLSKDPAAKLLKTPQDVPWSMIVLLAHSEEKDTPSSFGMHHCAETSPYYSSWVKQAREDYGKMLSAIKEDDFAAIGGIMEENALAMHCCMMASRPPLLYWNESTFRIIRAIRTIREMKGIQAYFTVDAGSNVIVLCKQGDSKEVIKNILHQIGELRYISCKPAGGAEIISVE
ncbi:MAG: diphosphomevalonate decarboxylase [candidate division Zixibacteria bacterium]|nr:diphosphomevalonate decarboxylase [candidate division Zixibacteria bacterium]